MAADAGLVWLAALWMWGWSDRSCPKRQPSCSALEGSSPGDVAVCVSMCNASYGSGPSLGP